MHSLEWKIGLAMVIVGFGGGFFEVVSNFENLSWYNPLFYFIALLLLIIGVILIRDDRARQQKRKLESDTTKSSISTATEDKLGIQR
jgi:hypothetical protein